MIDQNIKINILTFNPEEDEKNFSFSYEKKQGFFPIKKKECPTNLQEQADSEKYDEIKYLYTDFKSTSEDINLTVNLKESTTFANHYYTYLIYEYFKNVADAIQFDFINDLLVWFKDEKESDEQFNAYHVFRLRVQNSRVSDYPELLIAYHALSKVFKESILELDDIDKDDYTRVIWNKHIHKYKYLPDQAKYELQNVYPALNYNLKNSLNIPFDNTFKIVNKYKKHYTLINDFLKKHIITSDFKNIIPINTNEFISFNPDNIFSTSHDSNKMIFGQEKTNISPKFGINSGVYKHPPDSQDIEFFYICHKDHEKKVKEFDDYFKGKKPISKYDKPIAKDKNGNSIYAGISKYIGVTHKNYKAGHILFENINNPAPEVLKAIEKNDYKTNNKRYIAIYISPISKTESNPEQHRAYYLIKEALLKPGITSQVINIDNIGGYGFEWTLQNIFVSISAKLDGIPWRLERTVEKELIVGIGAFKSLKFDSRYIGSAFSFSNEGHFQSFDAFRENNMIKLAGSIRTAVEKFKKDNKDIKRLIIHFYKTMSNKNIRPIQEALQSLNYNVPIIIVTINKTESFDYVPFDTNFNNLIPLSGTSLKIGKSQYLLCNNTRYGSNPEFKIESYPFPVKLSFWSTDEKLIESKTTINLLIDQIYQFSRMYWKSVKQQKLPVTIKYPEMVAELFPYFTGNTLPPFGKKNLWFL
ncbi:MAG: hypothetical protein L3J35_01865 [Bacteroidales bacterium]|nr:hypothetical protein [Bacteroidales bacterium]